MMGLSFLLLILLLCAWGGKYPKKLQDLNFSIIERN